MSIYKIKIMVIIFNNDDKSSEHIKEFYISNNAKIGNIAKYKNFILNKNDICDEEGNNLYEIKYIGEENGIAKEIFESIDKHSDFNTIEELFERIEKIFAKFNEPPVDKLIGDIGEIISILKLQSKNIDYQKYYQLENNEEFDYNFNNKLFDIKTTTKASQTITLNIRQLQQIKKFNANIIVIEITKQSGFLNILDLMDKINIKNKLINEKIIFWNKHFVHYENIINGWTIEYKNLDKIIWYLYNRENFIDIIDENNILADGNIKLKINQKKENINIEKFIK